MADMSLFKAIREKNWENVHDIVHCAGDSFLKGSYVDALDEHGYTALHLLVKNKQYSAAHELITRWKANVTIVSRIKQKEMFFLLDSHMNKSPVLPLHEIVLQHAAPEFAIKMLISPDIINMKDVDGCTALHLAVLYKSWVAVSTLLEHGANRDLEDRNNKTALQYAIPRNVPVEIFKKLCTPKNATFASKPYHLPVALIILKRNWDLLPCLAEHGVGLKQIEIIEKDRTINTLLGHLITRVGRAKVDSKVIAALLPHLDANAIDKNGNTPLHLIVEQRRWELVYIFINVFDDKSLAAGLNAKDRRGNTALAFAIRNNCSLNVASALITTENVKYINNERFRPLQLAEKLRKWDLVHLIMQYDDNLIPLDCCFQPQELYQEPRSLQLQTIMTIRQSMGPRRSDFDYAKLKERKPLPEMIVNMIKLHHLADKKEALVKQAQAN